MIRSRTHLARMDAAAIDCERESPLTMYSCSNRNSGRAVPSIRRRPGVTDRCARARRMARPVAQRMFRRSTSFTDAAPIPHVRTRDLICTARTSRRRAVSFLESRSPSIGSASGANTTAAATTGPARGPRPTSSRPATYRHPSPHNSRSRSSVGMTLSDVASLPDPSRLARELPEVREFGSPNASTSNNGHLGETR